ncbi:TOR complex subunit lst8 [Gaertneriomyces sp. JEL0708]|nr:TOR complex subunit lst8 [Gaertneriomyces sp. JEL0708]
MPEQLPQQANAVGVAGTASGAQQQQQAVTEVVLATAGYDHTIRFWEALSGICLRTIQHPDSQVNKLCISPDKRYLAAAGNPHVRLYEVQTSNANPITSFDGHTANVTSIAFQSAARWLVTSSEDGTIKIWDVRAPGIKRNYELKCPVNDVIIHPNQGELVSCDQSGMIKVWDLGENACTHEFSPQDDVPIRSLTIAADGTFLCAANNRGNIFSYRTANSADLSSLTPAYKTKAHSKYITKCLLSPDTKLLATCSADSTIKIWSTQPNQHNHQHTRRGEPLNYNASHKDGHVVNNGTDSNEENATKQKTDERAELRHRETLRLIGKDKKDELEDEENDKLFSKDVGFRLEKTLKGHQKWAWDCAFSADSAYLVSGSSDHSARLWDLATGETIRHYNGHQKAVVCVALHDVSM